MSQSIDAMSHPRGLVLNGPIGIGKSHLLNLVGRDLRSDNWSVVSVVANSATFTIPFGAVAGFVSGSLGLDRLSMLRATVASLRGSNPGRPRAVLIDDAHHLDPESTAVIRELCNDTNVAIAMTIRSGEPVPIQVQDLILAQGFITITLPPLDRAETKALIQSETKFDDDSAVEALVDRSRGNALFASELGRALTSDTEQSLSPHLTQLIQARLGRLSPLARHQLSLVAISDPLDTRLPIADRPTLQELERASLISTSKSEGKVVARVSHPLYGEVVVSGLTPLDRQVLCEELAEAFLDQPLEHGGDSLRLAGWLLDVGEEIPSTLAAKAASEAIGRLDQDLAERLINIAIANGATGYLENYAAGVVARAAGDVQGSLDWFRRALDIAQTDLTIRQSAMALAQVHVFYLKESISGVEVLEEATKRMTDPLQQLVLESELALFASMTGRFEVAISAANRILEHPLCDSDSAWAAITNAAWAEAQVLKVEKLAEHLDLGFALVPGVMIEKAGSIDVLRSIDIGYQMVMGRLVRSTEQLRGLDHPGTVASGVADFSLSQSYLVRGQFSKAAHISKRSIETLKRYDAFNALPFVMAFGAIVRVVEGDREGAIELIESAISRESNPGPWPKIWIPYARAAVAASDGAFEKCGDLIDEAGGAAVESSHLLWAMTVYHSSVGWGFADRFLPNLQSLAQRTDQLPLISAFIEHAEAVASKDVLRLERLKNRFDEYGACLHSAQVEAELAHLSGDPTNACLLATRAALACPRPVLLPPGTGVLALSERQIEIATAAANGETSKAIANKLFLSARTVDNHLRTIYRRLGISGRDQLRESLTVS